MSGGADGQGDERVEELLRINAALAAEVRSLTLGRIDAPRSAPMPTARRIAATAAERDTAQRNFEDARVHARNVEAERDRLRNENATLAAEVSRLRGGRRGLLRRARARLLRY